MSYLLDSVALYYLVQDSSLLSANAQIFIQANQQSNPRNYISAVSLYELGMKAKDGRLKLDIGVDELFDRLHQSDSEIVPVTEEIIRLSVALKWEHKDPGDRMIVATASFMKLPILTSDRKIRDFYPDTIW